MTGHLIGWAAAAMVIWIGWLIFESCFWPFRSCRRCKGNGRHTSPMGRAFRTCRKCKGTGRRVRLGRRLWTKAGLAKKNLAD